MSAIHHIMTAIDSLQTIPDYLCFTALEAGQFTLTIPAAVTPTYLSYVEWSKDGRTWNHTDNTSEAVTIDVQVASGEKVYWRGSGNRCTADTTVATSALNVSSDARFDASGHLLSILKGNDYENVSGVQRYTFCNLFYQNTALVHAHDLVLPPVGLTGVFFQLFRGCSSLVSPPASIPLTTIPAWGCRGMYYDCSSLITPTDLIATTYGNTACTFMYRGCASLTRIATLPTVTSLVDSAQFQQMYYGCTSLTRAELYTVTAPFKKQLFSAMFYRCKNLNYIKCLYTDLSADQAFTDWLQGVSSTGTFIQAEGVTWPRGASGIPTGWVDVEKRTMPSGYKQVEYVANPNKPSATPMPIVETGIVLDPSQDTIEIAVFPHIDDDGYIAHHRYGGLPIANNMSPAQSGAKVGRFYCMYRKIDSANVIQFSWTKATSANSTLTATNKIVETPQVLRIELLSGNNKMLLNGTQVATNSDACDISDPGTETAKLFGINNVGYNWIDPIYYMKWRRNGVLIADYVACVRESDNEPSFYDFVSNTFKVPTRTGFFTAGEEI